MAGGRDEEQAAVDTGILDEAITHGGQLLAKEGRVLVLDVLDDGLPAMTISEQEDIVKTTFQVYHMRA